MFRELKRSPRLMAAGVVALVAIVLTVVVAPLQGVQALPRPAPGQALSGVQLDWTTDTPAAYEERLGATPEIIGAFEPFPLVVDAELDRIAGEVRATNGTLMLTLEPHGGLGTVTDASLAELTDWLVTWNEQGLPVIVRFAHEMNGTWYAWGQQPEAYVAAFRRAAAAVRAAPSSEILWSPNEGSYYPFPSGEPPATAREFELLDTDGDGRLTQSDDPYAPYFPGDEHVDWVGLSVYHFGHDWPWGDNEVPEPGKFEAKLTGTYDGRGGDHTAVPDFHAEYGVERDHPVIIAETSALYTTAGEGASNVEIKRAWLEQVFADDLPERLPALKAIVWFEHDKEEQDLPGILTRWSATTDPEVLRAKQEALPDWLQLG
jgi:hypothetical protein